MISQKRFYPWAVVAMLAVVSLLNYLDRQMLATMQPYIQNDIPQIADPVNFGRLMAIFLWVYALMSPVSGLIADRCNRKWLIVFSLFIWSAVTLGMGYVDNIRHLYILRGIMGISEAFYIPSALSLVADYHRGSTRSLAIGALTAGIYVGQAIGGFGATLSQFTSWHFTFKSFGLVGIGYSLLLIVLLHENKSVRTAKQTADGAPKAVASSKGITLLIGNVVFWTMLFYFSALNLPGWATKNWLPTMICSALNLPMAYIGPMWTVTLSLSSFLGVFIGGYLSDHWVARNIRGRVFTSSLGLAMIIPALLLVLFADMLPAILAGSIVYGIGFGIYDANNMPIICQFFPNRTRATCYGIMNCVGMASGAVITQLLGYAIKNGYSSQVFITMILAVALSVMLQLWVLRPVTTDMTDELMLRQLSHKS
ncbi:MAG: MFS transporter [Muribaculaceae bacterium]